MLVFPKPRRPNHRQIPDPRSQASFWLLGRQHIIGSLRDNFATTYCAVFDLSFRIRSLLRSTCTSRQRDITITRRVQSELSSQAPVTAGEVLDTNPT